MSDLIERLFSVIPIGKKNAIHLNTLSDVLGVNETAAKKSVQQARNIGFKICSGQVGYWIPENDDDIRIYEAGQRRQAFTRLKTTKPMRDGLKEYKGQISFSDFSNKDPEEAKINGGMENE